MKGKFFKDNSDDILKEITDGFRKRARETGGLKWGVLRFDVGDGRYITINGESQPNVVDNSFLRKADCVFKCRLDTLMKILAGKVTVGSAMDEVSITGDLRVAMVMGPAGTDQPTPRPSFIEEIEEKEEGTKEGKLPLT